jgi:hypothetical protein
MRIRWAVILCCVLLPSCGWAQGWQREQAEVYQTFPEEPLYRAFLPPAADFSSRFPTPGDQGAQGSCTAWAVGYALRSYYEGLVRGWSLESASHVVSPASIYNKLTRDPGACKDGTAISDALKLLHRDGAADLASLPYSPATCAAAIQESRWPREHWRIADWRRVNMTRLDNVKGEIVRGNPVVFGLDYSKSFVELKSTSIYDDTDSPREGGHAMVAVGYDDARQAFKVINSWGTRWADGGFGWVSYRAMQTLSDRGFVMSVAAAPARPPPGPVVPPLPPSSTRIAMPPPIAVEGPPDEPHPIVTTELTPVPRPVIDGPSPPIVADTPPPVIVPPTPIVSVLESSSPTVILPALPPLPPAPQPPQSKPTIAENPEFRLARIIADLRCARIDVARVHSAIVGVSGFVPSTEDRARLAEALGKNGARLLTDLRIYPWPQCEALQTFASALAKADGLSIQITDARAHLTEGESMTVDITTPDFPSYLYVTYLQTSGDAVHLAQPVGLAPQRYPPHTTVRLGGGGTQPTYRIGPPFGDEMIVVIASASPLFAAPRPPSEIERDYLTAFRLAFLAKPEAGMPDRIVAAAVTTLSTRPRK